ncbi:MAG: energy-coupling factor transporter transmembrane protein EcfT [Anaerolineaceae bacterium]|nr:energy-coupling factor transporter transmembrane protein EcfT [Anaerolineaceae bacterium]
MAIEFQKGTSFLHKLDARTKLGLFVGATVLAVVVEDPIIMACLFFALLTIGLKSVNRPLLLSNLRVLVVIFLTFSLFQVFFFTPDASHFLFYLIPFKNAVPVTVEGLIRGFAVFFRFFSVVLAVHLMLYTTPPVELALTITEREQQKNRMADAAISLLLGVLLFTAAYPMLAVQAQRLPLSNPLQWTAMILFSLACGFLLMRLSKRGLPAEMGIALTLGFATVGILSKQTQKITDAQKARGYDVQPKNIIQRVKVLTALLLPIFLATLERSQDISIAILSRGFDYDINSRTYLRQLAFKKNDYLILAILFTLIVTGLVMNHLGISNPTEQFILSFLH